MGHSLKFASLFLIFMLVNGAIPPASWKEHCDYGHTKDLTRKFYNDQVAIYFAPGLSNSITWPNTYLTDAWNYVKSVYGNFGGDGRLYAIFHPPTPGYDASHPHQYFNEVGDYRTVIDCVGSDFVSSTGNNLDVVTHEIAHIVEGSSNGVLESPAFSIWGDSKWAEIFQYDVYRGLGKTAEATRWYNLVNDKTENFPRAGTKWFKNWFYPIYSMYGEEWGNSNLKDFFRLLAENFPKDSTPEYTRRMNMGEFVHFWSGACQENLKDLATTAFGWTSEYEEQFNQAREDFPNLPYDQVITFYASKDHDGSTSEQYLTGGCSNALIYDDFSDRTSSIDSHGRCVRIYEDVDCGGNSKYISTDSRNECTHSDLSSCGFDNTVTSFSNC